MTGQRNVLTRVSAATEDQPLVAKPEHLASPTQRRTYNKRCINPRGILHRRIVADADLALVFSDRTGPGLPSRAICYLPRLGLGESPSSILIAVTDLTVGAKPVAATLNPTPERSLLPPDTRSLRYRLFRQLSPRQWPSEGLSPLNKAIGVLILVSVVVAALESEVTIHDGNEALFRTVELVIGGIFLTEYLGRVWVAPEGAPEASATRARLRFMVSPAGLLDLVALMPLFVTVLGPEAFVLRFARMLRILRFARLGQFSGAFTLLSDALASRKHELFVGVCVAAALLMLSATLLYVVEGDAQPEAFGSIPRAMWWAIATLTTVGYGDVAPITWLGRVCAGFIAVLGIGLIAIPTGILAAAFSDAAQQQRARKEARKSSHRRDPPH